jgi:aspartate kinase
MGKTTRGLLEAAEASAAGDTRKTLRLLASLKTRHLSEARRLVKSAAGRQVSAQIDGHFDELKKLLEGLAILGEVPPRGLDKILAYGELLSSAIVAGALAERGLPSQLLDSRDFIKTDDNFGSASPLFDLTNTAATQVIKPYLERSDLPVVQGFIGSTRDGATTTLGFEGSDYTATILGAALDAGDIQIWKDVSGLMTADPEIYEGARTVKVCTYREAADLTYLGAKVLHPKAIQPAAGKNISVHIYNSRQPEARGTSIGASAPRCSNPVKSIAYKRPINLLRIDQEPAIDGARAVSSNEFLRTVLLALNRNRVNPLMTTVSASTVVLAIDSRATPGSAERDLTEELSRFSRISSEPDHAIVSLVGEELPGDRQLAARVFKALGNIAVRAMLHGSSPLSMSFVVAQGEVEKVVARLHEALFEKCDPKVFE